MLELELLDEKHHQLCIKTIKVNIGEKIQKHKKR